MSTKVIYILSKVDKAVAFEWIVEEFKNSTVQLEFILLNDNFNTQIVEYLASQNIKIHQFKLGSKKNYLQLIYKIYKVLNKSKPEVVHTHLLEATLLGLFAAKLAGIKKRIYTRHHSTSQHEYFPHAVKYDRFNNWQATHIIAISNNVKKVLIELEQVNPSKIHLIEHGFKLSHFKNVDKSRVHFLKDKYNIPTNKVIVGAISRYLKWKGVEYVIDAFKAVYEKNPTIHLLLANSGGSYEQVIKQKLKGLPAESYTEIQFEPDLFALYQLIDIFCHVPINHKVEAFGQTYVEALAAGVPSIFTLSGIANDFIVHRKNALVVDYEDSAQIAAAISEILEHKDLPKLLVSNGVESIQRFELSKMMNKLRNLYLSST